MGHYNPFTCIDPLLHIYLTYVYFALRVRGVQCFEHRHQFINSAAKIKFHEVFFKTLLAVKQLATVSYWLDEQFLPSLNSMHR